MNGLMLNGPPPARPQASREGAGLASRGPPLGTSAYIAQMHLQYIVVVLVVLRDNFSYRGGLGRDFLPIAFRGEEEEEDHHSVLFLPPHKIMEERREKEEGKCECTHTLVPT